MPANPRQMSLFDRPRPARRPAAPPVDPRVTPVETPRLCRQAAAILERLQAGAAMNTELREITHRFGARIKDLRAAGHAIETIYVDRRAGLVQYQLAADGAERTEGDADAADA